MPVRVGSTLHSSDGGELTTGMLVRSIDRPRQTSGKTTLAKHFVTLKFVFHTTVVLFLMDIMYTTTSRLQIQTPSLSPSSV